MTAPMTAERRAEIEGIIVRLGQYEGTVFEKTACWNGLREEAAGTLSLLMQEIDRLTDERDAAVAAAVMAEREACAAICDEFAQIELTVLFNGPAMSRQIALSIRSRPAPAPAVEGRTP